MNAQSIGTQELKELTDELALLRAEAAAGRCYRNAGNNKAIAWERWTLAIEESDRSHKDNELALLRFKLKNLEHTVYCLELKLQEVATPS